MTPAEQHIWTWITDYVEQNHAFYNHRFPPCPYAQKARLSGAVEVYALQSNYIERIRNLSWTLLDTPAISTRVIALPTLQRWNFSLLHSLKQYNSQLVDRDTYLQWGWAQGTRAAIGLVPGRYFVVIANRLAAVMAGSAALKKTDYYDHWPNTHLDRVVGDRERAWNQKSSKHTPSLHNQDPKI